MWSWISDVLWNILRCFCEVEPPMFCDISFKVYVKLNLRCSRYEISSYVYVKFNLRCYIKYPPMLMWNFISDVLWNILRCLCEVESPMLHEISSDFYVKLNLRSSVTNPPIECEVESPMICDMSSNIYMKLNIRCLYEISYNYVLKIQICSPYTTFIIPKCKELSLRSYSFKWTID